MVRRPTVFLTRDTVLDDVLERIGRQLHNEGVRVVRDWAPARDAAGAAPPPALAEAEVALFTMRTRCDAAMLHACPRLAGVVYPTIGVETLDLDAANDLGIAVGHGAMPENYLGVAEAVILLMLMWLYQPLASRDVALGRRARPAPRADAVWARMLRRRKVGLLGCGRIGRAIIERLQGWEVDIHFHDPYLATGDTPGGATGVSLETLLRESDVVVVSVALTAETRDIIDTRTLGWMKPDAYLINVSRGEAIDEAALEQALRDGRIAGAALDVSRVEPMPQDHPLLRLDNCFVTPHMIGQTREVFEAIVPVAAENILRLLRGELPLYCRNPGVAERWAARRAALAQNGPARP